MDIIYSNNKAVSEVAVFQMSAPSPTPPVTLDRTGNPVQTDIYEYAGFGKIDNWPWVRWGMDNLRPNCMADKVRKSGILNSTISAKARIAIGKGIVPCIITGRSPTTGDEIINWISDPEIEEWLEFNNNFSNSLQSIRDFIGFGWSHSRIFMDNARENIVGYQTDDVVNCRLGRMDPMTGIIQQTYFSPAWQYVDSDISKYKTITLLSENHEHADLLNKLQSGSKDPEYSIISRDQPLGRSYYPHAAWESVEEWVDLVIQVPQMKTAMFNNQMSIKYLVTISTRYFEKGDPKWNTYTAAERQQIFADKVAEINKHLTGNQNYFKSIAVSSYIDPNGNVIKDIEIDVLDDKVKDGKLLPDASAGDKQILFSLMMNPAIMGANLPSDPKSGSAGSGSDIREAYCVLIMLMEAERQMNSKIFNVIKRFNGWADKYKGQNLQFRYPNLILTALDTGGSTAIVNP